MFNAAKQALSKLAPSTSTMSSSLAPSPLPQYIYKILPHHSVDSKYAFPVPIPASHEFFVSPLDAKDGYFHLSTPSQVLGTLDRFFADVPAVTLLRIDYGRLSGFKTVKWEQAGSGVYPHLYAHSLEGENVDSFKEVFRLAEDKGEKASWAPELEKLKVEGWFV